MYTILFTDTLSIFSAENALTKTLHVCTIAHYSFLNFSDGNLFGNQYVLFWLTSTRRYGILRV